MTIIQCLLLNDIIALYYYRIIALIMNAEIQDIIPVLEADGLIILPTDTVWCLACNALNEKALSKMFAIRTCEDDFAILMDNYARMKPHIAVLHPKATALVDYHQRPLTIIYNDVKALPEIALGEDNSIGIQLTKDGFCKTLIGELGAPLAVMAAHYPNESYPQNFDEINTQLLQAVDYVVKYRREETEKYDLPTMLRIKADGELDFLRK